MTYGFLKKRWFPYVFGLLIVVGSACYAFSQSDSDTGLVQSVCFLAAFIWIIYTARTMIQSIVRVNFHQLRIHPAWLLVLAAIVLRYSAFAIFPPANLTGFEELQTGSIAYRILLTHELPIEFRFTNLLGFIGLISRFRISLILAKISISNRGPRQLNLAGAIVAKSESELGPDLIITFIADDNAFSGHRLRLCG